MSDAEQTLTKLNTYILNITIINVAFTLQLLIIIDESVEFIGQSGKFPRQKGNYIFCAFICNAVVVLLKYFNVLTTVQQRISRE